MTAKQSRIAYTGSEESVVLLKESMSDYCVTAWWQSEGSTNL